MGMTLQSLHAEVLFALTHAGGSRSKLKKSRVHALSSSQNPGVGFGVRDGVVEGVRELEGVVEEVGVGVDEGVREFEGVFEEVGVDVDEGVREFEDVVEEVEDGVRLEEGVCELDAVRLEEGV